MSKGKAFKIYKRAMAFFMAAALVFSSFQGMSLTAYAAEDIVISDADLQETEEMIEEAVEETAIPEEIEEEPEQEEPVAEETQAPAEEPVAEETQAPEEEPVAEESTPEITEEPVAEETAAPEETQEPVAEATPEVQEEAADESEDVKSDGEVIEEPAMVEFAADNTLPYSGEVWDDGKGLGIYFHAMTDTMEFTDENLVAILESHSGSSFENIQINYPNIPDVVNKDVWNAVKAISAEDATFHIGFTGGGMEADEMWTIDNLTTASEDVELSAEWEVQENGNLSVSFGNTVIPAESNFFSINAYQTNTEEIYNSLKGIFPESCSTKMKDGNGNRVGKLTHYVDVDDSKIDVYIYDVNLLTADTTYSVSKLPAITYKGTVDNETGTLEILASEISKEYGEFNDDILIDILDANPTKRYNHVVIDYDQVKDAINKNVWNLAAELLIGDAPELIIGCSDVSLPNENWIFVNPGLAEADLNTAIDVVVNDAGAGVNVSFGNTTFPADAVTLVYNYASSKDGIEAFKEAFYMKGEGYETAIRDENGNAVNGLESNFIVDEDGSARFITEVYKKTGEGVNQLADGSCYTILTPCGGVSWTDENNGVTGLDIVLSEMGRESITATELQRILAENGEARYDEILIEYPYAQTNTIAAEILNLMAGYLKEKWSEDVDQYLRIAFNDGEAQTRYEIRICNPDEQTEDKTVSVILSAEEENPVTIQVTGASFNAQRTDVMMEYGIETATAKLLMGYWGEENIPLALEGLSTGAYYDVYDNHVSIYFDEVNGYDESAHVIGDGRYFGDVQGDETSGQRLTIDYHELEARGQDASPEAFKEILESKKDQKFVAVNLIVPAGDNDRENEINKEVYNAARALLTTAENREGIYYNFNHDEKNILWYFMGGDALTKNVTLKWAIDPNEFSKVGLKVNLPSAKDLGNAEVRLAVEYVKGTGEADMMQEFFGEAAVDGPDSFHTTEYRLFPRVTADEKGGDPVKWVDMGESLKVGFRTDLLSLTKDAEYTIINKFPAQINEDENDRNLSISRWDIGKASFAAGYLADCLSYYVSAVENGEMDPFNNIYVEQPNVAGQNTIRKNDINLLLKLLPEEIKNDENNRNLTFGFCNCIYDGKTDINYTDDVNWNFHNPRTATKDINANVTLNQVINQGMTFKVAANTYNAEDVSLQFRVYKDTEKGACLIAELGDVSENGRELVVLNKKTLALTKNYADCWSEENNTVYNVNISNMATCVADTTYLVAQLHDLFNGEAPENRFFVGDNQNNVAKLHTLKKPDAGTLSWKSYDTNVLRIAADGSSVEALNWGEVFYAASYKVDGVQTLEVYKNAVEAKLNSMQFTRDTIEMTLPEEGADWIAEDYLNLQFYPSIAGIGPNELIWEVTEVEGENVVRLDTFLEIIEELEDGSYITEERYTGGITALNPGKVIVTATVPDTEISASCTIIVYAPAQVPDYAWPDVWAVTNFDDTLETVEFHVNEENVPEGETVTWRWEDPTMSLATFKNMDGHDFNAIYKLPDGREITSKVWVRMVTIEGLRIVRPVFDEESNSITIDYPVMVLHDGEKLVMDFEYMIRNGGYEDIAEYVEAENLNWEWSSNPEGCADFEEIVADSGLRFYTFTADLDKEGKGKGKKTFTVALKRKEDDRVIAKGSHTVTVLENPLTSWSEMEFKWEAENEKMVGVPGEKGNLVIKLPKDGYNKLTFTSLDTGICKLGKKPTVDKSSDEDFVITKISYEMKAGGTAYIKIESNDEVKSGIRLNRPILDIAPKYAGGTIQYNKKQEDLVREFVVQLAEGSVLTATNPVNYTLSGKGSEYFDIVSIGEPENGKVEFAMHLVNTSAPKGNYTLKLNLGTVTYYNGEEEVESSDTYSVNISVKVTESVPTVTFGQSGKVNLFYTDEEGYAQLTMKTGGYQIYDLVLTDCDYELIYPEDGLYLIKLIDGKSGTDTKGKISYMMTGYTGKQSKSFTVKKENKAPALTLSAKKDVLYPTAQDWDTMLEIYDKATKEPIRISKLQWIKNAKKKQYEDIRVAGYDDDSSDGSSAPAYSVINMKNTYGVDAFENRIGFYLTGEKNVAKTDTISLRVWEENWSEPVKVSYSIITNLKVPTLVLANKTITINVNEAVYKDQMVGTKLSFKNATESVRYIPVTFVGTDAKSRAILNDNFILEYWGDTGNIWAKFNARGVEDRPATGTYTYNIYADVFEKVISTKLTVKVVDTPVDKCLTVTKKGSIDVLNREGTSITYTPKLKTVTGSVTDAWLTGRDADLFETVYDGKKLVVKARIGTMYSTAYDYQVKPVFHVQNEYGSGYELTGKSQTIKVKQGKAKVTVSAPSNVLYRDRANELEIFFKATSEKKTPVVIEDVNLVNYQSDLWLEELEMRDDQNNEYMVHFDPDTQSVTLSQPGVNQMVAKNKTWKVKFEVRFRDKAGNVNTQQVTYKLVIK